MSVAGRMSSPWGERFVALVLECGRKDVGQPAAKAIGGHLTTADGAETPPSKQ